MLYTCLFRPLLDNGEELLNIVNLECYSRMMAFVES